MGWPDAYGHRTRVMTPPRAIGLIGGSGFLGRWVAHRAEVAGYRVEVAARNAGYTRDRLEGWCRASIAEVDLTNDGALGAWCSSVRPVCLVNAAGYGVDPRERENDLAEEVNVLLPTRVLRALAGSCPEARYIHLGSAQEYGAVGGDLQEEGPTAPTTLYGRTKLQGTREVLRAARELGASAVVARLFTVFGEGESSYRLFPTLLRAASGEGSVPLTEGFQQRDFACAGEVATAVLDLATWPGSTALGLVVNVACGALHSVRDFVLEVARQKGIAPARLAFGAVPTRSDEMQHDAVNVSRLRGMLGRTLTPSLVEQVRTALQTRPG